MKSTEYNQTQHKTNKKRTNKSKEHTQPQKKKKTSEKQPEPLFSKFLSNSDFQRIKSLKTFVKSSQPSGSLLNRSNLPYQDNPEKLERFYNYLCSQEGLEVGGIRPAPLMTASQIKSEKSEFSKEYTKLKNSNVS